jgi:predicted Zn-dependent peptidase
MNIVRDPRVGDTASFVGIYIQAGRRNENQYNNGVAHYTHTNAFAIK